MFIATKTTHTLNCLMPSVPYQAQRRRKTTRRKTSGTKKSSKKMTPTIPTPTEPEHCGPLRARQAITVTDKDGVERTLVCLKHKDDYIWTELDSKRLANLVGGGGGGLDP